MHLRWNGGECGPKIEKTVTLSKLSLSHAQFGDRAPLFVNVMRLVIGQTDGKTYLLAEMHLRWSGGEALKL